MAKQSIKLKLEGYLEHEFIDQIEDSVILALDRISDFVGLKWFWDRSQMHDDLLVAAFGDPEDPTFYISTEMRVYTRGI